MFARLTISLTKKHIKQCKKSMKVSAMWQIPWSYWILGLAKYFENNADYYGVFLETAHLSSFGCRWKSDQNEGKHPSTNRRNIRSCS